MEKTRHGRLSAVSWGGGREGGREREKERGKEGGREGRRKEGGRERGGVKVLMCTLCRADCVSIPFSFEQG